MSTDDRPATPPAGNVPVYNTGNRASRNTVLPPAPAASITPAPAASITPAPAAPAPDDPVELQLALGALKFLGLVTIPVIAVAWLFIGQDGALSAGIAIALVAGMYLMSGVLLSYAAKFGPEALMAAALGGFALRLCIYALLLVLLTPVERIHGPTLAVTAAVLIVATLVFEARMVSRIPNLYWVDAQAARHRTRSAPATTAPAPSSSQPTRKSA